MYTNSHSGRLTMVECDPNRRFVRFALTEKAYALLFIKTNFKKSYLLVQSDKKGSPHAPFLLPLLTK